MNNHQRSYSLMTPAEERAAFIRAGVPSDEVRVAHVDGKEEVLIGSAGILLIAKIAKTPQSRSFLRSFEARRKELSALGFAESELDDLACRSVFAEQFHLTKR